MSFNFKHIQYHKINKSHLHFVKLQKKTQFFQQLFIGMILINLLIIIPHIHIYN
jgi:hypothetical protein